MNKDDLVSAIAENTGVSKGDVDASIAGMFDVVAGHVSHSDDKISIPGWLSFERTFRQARKGRNPRTGEELDIAATHAVKVSAGAKLKKAAKGA
ncbi:MAG: HU family DNA-binding protein [Acidimicrobiia bacterium]|nr:HU family DNA-binding protein [Acidimicrobiia bacterium]